jgi:prepilin-type N-terminal cleavage/methylation domain-containing protein
MRKGFTLVELSIALVIIGLLIGGILVGKSMIDSVKVSKEVSRISQWSIAIIQFKQKFKQEAGDSNLFSPSGNNSKTAGDMQTGSCPTDFVDELYTSWSHLSASGILKESYSWDISRFCDDDFKGVIPFAKAGPDYEYLGTPMNAFHIFSQPSGNNFGGKNYLRYLWVTYPAYTAWGIEKKIDDGVLSQTTGNISSGTLDYNYLCDSAGVQDEADGHGVNSSNIYCYQTIYFSPSSAPELPITTN